MSNRKWTTAGKPTAYRLAMTGGKIGVETPYRAASMVLHVVQDILNVDDCDEWNAWTVGGA